MREGSGGVGRKKKEGEFKNRFLNTFFTSRVAKALKGARGEHAVFYFFLSMKFNGRENRGGGKGGEGKKKEP